ncbi:MAG: DegT/DnrJ/EryC1/StrS family aminotransferase, partial [Candidatus Harrisonbacteria bacterium]|nr:DegT/DnrJ/EryC1/StrS family aminotransferase [Candidatus Harrisonbacteria bacterium]
RWNKIKPSSPMKGKIAKSKLALFGGDPVFKKTLSPIHNIGREEVTQVLKVLEKGPLSGFLASAGEGFSGGPTVQELERRFSRKFKIKHAVSFNSATTALHGAMAALGIGPGDEVIVSPYTMSASATAILMNGAIPIFADIDAKTFCLSPSSVQKCISRRTKAIMAVNLFGQSANYHRLISIGKKYGLAIVEDNAQSPGAKYEGLYTGTIGDVGIFSFNLHKIIQAGEGGMLVTNSDTLALRARLARNHGEVVVDQIDQYAAGPIIGSNYRMPEVIAAIMLAQLPKLNFFNRGRIKLVRQLERGLKTLEGISPAYTDPKSTHVYYRYAMKVDEKKLGISRDRLADAMRAEGFSLSKGYVKPIYLLPVFQQRKVFNQTNFPFSFEGYEAPPYVKGMCPTAERLNERELMLADICQYPYTKDHISLFVRALKKVLRYKGELT